MTEPIKNKGWTVTFAGTGINLALGILYTWSIFKGAIKASIEKGGEGAFAWDLAKLNDPYSVCCLCFAFSMILAGKCQDKFGPRATAFIGGILVAIGLLICSQTNAISTWIIGFGVLAGAGIGFGYSAATPPALKWFPPAKTGMIAGLVVAGFGLASVYIAPLSEYLIKVTGIQTSMMIFGIAFLIVVCGLSTLMVNPPAGYVPEGAAPQAGAAAKKPSANDATAAEMMATANFWILWFVYFIGAGVGLMVISSIAGIAKKSMPDAAFVAVAIMAIGNAGGRIISGMISDKNRQKLHSLYHAHLPGGAHVYRDSGDRHRAPERFSHPVPGNLYRLQLRGKPVSLSFPLQRPLGPQGLRHQLRHPVYRMGCGRLCAEPHLADAPGKQPGQLHLVIRPSWHSAAHRCSPCFNLKNYPGTACQHTK